jgi:hypothetical protein
VSKLRDIFSHSLKKQQPEGDSQHQVPDDAAIPEEEELEVRRFRCGDLSRLLLSS